MAAESEPGLLAGVLIERGKLMLGTDPADVEQLKRVTLTEVVPKAPLLDKTPATVSCGEMLTVADSEQLTGLSAAIVARSAGPRAAVVASGIDRAATPSRILFLLRMSATPLVARTALTRSFQSDTSDTSSHHRWPRSVLAHRRSSGHRWLHVGCPGDSAWISPSRST